MKSRSLVAVVLGFGAALVMAGGCDKCKKDEPPPPIPVTTPPPVIEASLTIEEAGEDAADAADGDGSDGRKIVGKPAATMKKCCDALAQNAASAPPPTNIYLQQAAAACSAAVAQGKEGASIMSIVSGMLKGAQMPAACK
jgi:hypothetical protein